MVLNPSGEQLIDTDVLSLLMRQHPPVVEKARNYVRERGTLNISVITQYEILRGLLVKSATQQSAAFQKFCLGNRVFILSEAIATQAAEIHADLRTRGEIINDADILIAATALAHGMGVVTNNEQHFRRVTGLHVENWSL